MAKEMYRSIFEQGNMRTAIEFQKFIVKLMRELKCQPQPHPVKKDTWGFPKFKIDFTFNKVHYTLETEDAHKENCEMLITYKGEKDGDLEAIKDVFNNAKTLKKLLTKACGDLQHTTEAAEKYDTLDYKRKLKVISLTAKESVRKISTEHPYFVQLINGKITFKEFIDRLSAFMNTETSKDMFDQDAKAVRRVDTALKNVFNHLLRTREINYHEHTRLTLGRVEVSRF